MGPRYAISAALPQDLEGVSRLAAHLNTVNLPDDREALKTLLSRSEDSFSAAVADPREREYVFVLRDRETDAILGTSTVIAQLGRRGSPYIYLEVGQVEKYSGTLDRHFVHTVLQTRYSYEGPTEIGGLVVHPDHRRSAQRLGTQISFVRFLFLAMRPADFQPQVLAELLPPLAPDGTSHLWEALGRHFTGLTYAEADRLSKTNKEFIRSLFPLSEVYAALLTPEAQEVIGKVGSETKAVERILSRIGFRYAHRVDPFDGGPHYIANRDAIQPLRDAIRVELIDADAPSVPHLVGVRYHASPYFLACHTPAEPVAGGRLGIPADLRQWFDTAGVGDAWCVPL